VTKVI